MKSILSVATLMLAGFFCSDLFCYSPFPILLTNSTIMKSILSVATLMLAGFFCSGMGEQCLNPKANSKSFISSEAVLSSDILVIGEFSLTCSNKPKSLSLHAEFDGELMPVTQSIDGGSYQFTIIRKPKELQVGTYTVKIFDDQSATELRKTLSADPAKAANIKPTFTVDVEYQGPTRGLLIPSEVLALASGISLSLLAFQARSKLSSH